MTCSRCGAAPLSGLLQVPLCYPCWLRLHAELSEQQPSLEPEPAPYFGCFQLTTPAGPYHRHVFVTARAQASANEVWKWLAESRIESLRSEHGDQLAGAATFGREKG